MRVVVTGAGGLLGHQICRQLSLENEVFGVSRRPQSDPQFLNSGVRRLVMNLLEIHELAQILLALRPDVIVHSAAISSPDAVALDPKSAWSVNVDTSVRLASMAATLEARFAFISSNAVFGDAEEPFKEDDPHCPVNAYGEQKSEAERRIIGAHPNPLIVRPILLFGKAPSGSRQSIAEQWARTLRIGQPIKALCDVHSQPTDVLDCAHAIAGLVNEQASGSVHLGGPETMSIYDFGLLIARHLEVEPDLVIPTTLEQLRLPAERPRRNALSITLAKTEFSFAPSPLSTSIARMLNENLHSE